MFQEDQVITTTVNLKTDSGTLLPVGTLGAVVMIYTNPTLGYEIELVDKNGNSYGTVTVTPDQIRDRK